LDREVLKDRFNHLFELSDNKMVMVAEMKHLGWGEECEAWNQRRRLWTWKEEQLRECSVVLD
jgi:hypothetical protein